MGSKFSKLSCTCTVVCHRDEKPHDHDDGNDHFPRCRQTRRGAGPRASFSSSDTDLMPRQRPCYTAPAHQAHRSRARTPAAAHSANLPRHKSHHLTQNHEENRRPMSPVGRPAIPNRASSLTHSAVIESQDARGSLSSVPADPQEQQADGDQPWWSFTLDDLQEQQAPRSPVRWEYRASEEIPASMGSASHVSDFSPSSTAVRHGSEEDAKSDSGPGVWWYPESASEAPSTSEESDDSRDRLNLTWERWLQGQHTEQ
ncbi:hypothetical protein C8A03DRAFT_31974 [Achaetomium macrosporum]|uniref:Uncharacterized protein n=1 Tax=Achaetomium macrosporum TaxID=79813 RepID=A0AAN7HCP2_9PEZI|nr:hypothetical protein C8A03DRAFT_31974 [Achaetomium macrosporum]